MKKFELPSTVISTNGRSWNAVTIIREMVLTLPFWKDEMNVSRVDACLEIEDALDLALELPFELKLSIDATNLLKEAMQLKNMNPIGNADLNRLYMTIYRNVLKAGKAS